MCCDQYKNLANLEKLHVPKEEIKFQAWGTKTDINESRRMDFQYKLFAASQFFTIFLWAQSARWIQLS